MATSLISLYDNLNQVQDGQTIALDLFLNNVREGHWQDFVFDVRVGKLKKDEIPYVTLGGTFTRRNEKGLEKPSGFIGIDIDDRDPNQVKDLVHEDPYVYAAFTSVSGKGSCLLFKINPEKHAEAFEGLEAYLFEQYKFLVDSQCRDVSRPRLVSYDPHLYLNEKAQKFTHYIKRRKEPTPKPVIFVQADFDHMVNELVQQQINLCESYHDWLRVGFALADQFGEAGRDYFHRLSQASRKYDTRQCDKQYNNCLKAGRTGVTIRTLYFLAKQAGVATYSAQTRLILTVAQQAKKAHRHKEDVVRGLREFEDIPTEASQPIIDQVYSVKERIESEENLIDKLELWLRQNYDLRKNIITGKLELPTGEVDDDQMNSIYRQAKKVFDREVNYELLDRVIHSDFTPRFNPLKDFLLAHAEDPAPGNVMDEYCACFTTDNDPYFRHFFERWMVGLIESIHGQHSPLMLVYTGPQNNGKTRAFRNLLPAELRRYYAESKLDAGKDDEILMCRKLIIMDDEMSGKSKAEERHMKELTSKDIFTLRAPYGRHNVDLKRLAVLCGTTNDERVLNDPTGNRRYVVIGIEKIDFARVDRVDRTQLLMEAYHRWKAGVTADLTPAEVEALNLDKDRFQDYSAEYELLTRYLRRPRPEEEPELLTATEVQLYLETVTRNARLVTRRLGMELKRQGYEQRLQRREGTVCRVYKIVKTGGGEISQPGETNHF